MRTETTTGYAAFRISNLVRARIIERDRKHNTRVSRGQVFAALKKKKKESKLRDYFYSVFDFALTRSPRAGGNEVYIWRIYHSFVSYDDVTKQLSEKCCDFAQIPANE